jgi:uracil-DNA glycosylase
MGGRALESAPNPPAVADAWDRTAFLEAVKCAPLRGVGEPTAEMWEECPPRYLAADLELLEPGVVVAIGRDVADALAQAASVAWDVDEAGFRRGRGRLECGEVEVLACNHPSRQHWRNTLPALAGSLSQRPLAPAQ